MLGAGVVVLQAYKNHQIQVSNPAFASVAWHNLKTDEIFPDHLGEGRGDESRAWSRQGIAKEASCTDALRKDLAEAAMAKGCTTVLRATYVDIGGSVAATIAVAVVSSQREARTLVEDGEFFWGDDPGPLVRPVAVPGTLAAKWTKERAMAGGADAIGTSVDDTPYVTAISAGPTDGSRAVGSLPDDWKSTENEESSFYWDVSTGLLSAFSTRFYRETQGWGE